LISPAALIMVSIAGVCGFALPNRDLANALRLWRFFLAWLGAVGGLFAVTCGALALVIHLAGLTTLDHPYLAPLAAGYAPPLRKRVKNQDDS
jgi:spore germination protein KA